MTRLITQNAGGSRQLRLALIGWLLVLAVPAAHAATATKTGDQITMQNDVLTLTIDLKMGARVDSFVYKPFGQNIIYPVKDNGGLLLDHVTDQNWPGEFLSRTYDAEIVKNGPDEAVVRVWTDGQEASTKGLRFERLITLKEGDRALACTLTIRNNGDLGRMTAYWAQNCFWFGGGKEGTTWARPTVRGIAYIGLDAQANAWFDSPYWWSVYDPTAGWNGCFNKERQQGMMCLMNYNDLSQLYDNYMAVTTEWMYDKVAIPAGKAWTTNITLLPVAGMTGFKYGSPHLIANFEATPAPGGLTIEHQLTRGPVPLKDVTVSTKVWGLKTEWTATVPDVKLAAVTEDVQKTTVAATGVGAMPAGIQVTVTGTDPGGKKVTETYGDYHGGDVGPNNNPFSMQPYLAFARPPKQKVYLKPDVIKYVPNATPKVLFLRGMWYQFFNADEAIKAAFPEATITDGWLDDTAGLGNTLNYFPGDYPSLLSYDLIILANLPAGPVGLVGEEMLKDYAAAGGNLLLLGGDQAFGDAGFANQSLIDLLPVNLGGPHNWHKLPGDNVLKVTAAVPATKGVVFGGKDVVLYSHVCVPKPGATVAVKAGDQPILVLGSTPKGGRIACVLATPFGEAGPGETAFWEAPAWNKLMENTVQWLVKHD
jgi:uncharacterized membrane protein